MRYKLGELVDLNPGSDTKVSKLDLIKYLDTSNLTEGKIENLIELTPTVDKVPSRAKRVVIENDILYSTVRPNQRHYGIIKDVVPFLVASTGFAHLRVNTKKAVPDYVYWLLTQDSIIDKLQSIAETSTSAYPSIRPSVITNLEFEFPPIEVQKQTVDILNSIAEKITTNYKIIEKIEELTKEIFRNWFIDFEFPNEQGRPYKTSGGKMVESELGMVPEGWKIDSLTNIANYKNGLAMQKYRPSESSKSLPVLKIKELNDGITSNNSDACSADIKEEVKVYNGDVIFSWSGTLLVKLWTGGNAGLNQHLFKVTSTNYPKWFYYFWTRHHLKRFIEVAKDKATTMGHINKSHLQKSLVVVPSFNILKSMNGTFGSLIEMQIQIGMENNRLIDLRNSVLPKLLSGEIEVPVLEIKQ